MTSFLRASGRCGTGGRDRAPRPCRPVAAETVFNGAAEGRHIGRPAPDRAAPMAVFQDLDRSEIRGEGPRGRGVLHEPAEGGGRAVDRREETDLEREAN